MRPRRRFSVPASSFFTRALSAVALGALVSACATFGGPPIDPEPRATIEFDNQSPDAVRVYLAVQDGGEFLLGRVYPMQSSFLTVPRHLVVPDARRVSLVVVPVGETGFSNRMPRAPHARELVSSLTELSTQRFVITPLALHGVLSAGPRLP